MPEVGEHLHPKTGGTTYKQETRAASVTVMRSLGEECHESNKEHLFTDSSGEMINRRIDQIGWAGLEPATNGLQGIRSRLLLESRCV